MKDKKKKRKREEKILKIVRNNFGEGKKLYKLYKKEIKRERRNKEKTRGKKCIMMNDKIKKR